MRFNYIFEVGGLMSWTFQGDGVSLIEYLKGMCWELGGVKDEILKEGEGWIGILNEGLNWTFHEGERCNWV